MSQRDQNPHRIGAVIDIRKQECKQRMNSNTKSALVLLVFLTFSLVACGNNQQFDSAKWLRSNMRDRGRMCEDLVKSKILIGQTVTEAQRLLGPPDFTYPTAFQYKIDLGWPLKDPVHYGLQLHFDANRRVREVKIVD